MLNLLVVIFLKHVYIFRLFMGGPDGAHPLMISSIILQSTASNLRKLIGPLTILDNILSLNVGERNDNIIPNDDKSVSVLSGLFSSMISGKPYDGNKYIWNTFNAFILKKQEIRINLYQIWYSCKDKEFLKVLFSDLIVREGYSKLITGVDYDYDLWIKNAKQNLFKPDIVKLFKNVKKISIKCTG